VKRQSTLLAHTDDATGSKKITLINSMHLYAGRRHSDGLSSMHSSHRITLKRQHTTGRGRLRVALSTVHTSALTAQPLAVNSTSTSSLDNGHVHEFNSRGAGGHDPHFLDWSNNIKCLPTFEPSV